MARQVHRLRACKIATLPSGSHFDGYGLELRVQNTGSRSWVQRLTVKGTGKRIALGLGSPPVVTLAEARDRALENARKAHRGVDPREAKSSTFERVAALWERQKRETEEWTDYKPFRSRLSRIINPTIGSIEIDKVNSAHLRTVISKGRSPTEKRRCIAEIKAIIKFAIQLGYKKGSDNPATIMLDSIPVPKRKHFKALHHAELKAALSDIAKSDAPESVRMLMLFNCLVPVRPAEARNAKRLEFDGDNWLIPSARMKARKDFLVPVSFQARAIIDGGIDEFIFAHNHKRRPPDSKTVDAWRDKILGSGRMTMHGIRSTFGDWAVESFGSETRELAERCLAHKVGDTTTNAYIRTDLAEQRRELLQAWADYLIPLGIKGKVLKGIVDYLT